MSIAKNASTLLTIISPNFFDVPRFDGTLAELYDQPDGLLYQVADDNISGETSFLHVWRIENGDRACILRLTHQVTPDGFVIQAVQQGRHTNRITLIGEDESGRYSRRTDYNTMTLAQLAGEVRD